MDPSRRDQERPRRAVIKHLPPGTYALALIHDENGNGKVDTNWIGMPKEGVGASNNATGTLGPPSWRDAKFELQAGGHARQAITITYL